ncbi:MAG: DUF1800 family protein [Burkholderiales bacterium]|nr:DUF1800 family protein [Burkholderiales bacterium]
MPDPTPRARSRRRIRRMAIALASGTTMALSSAVHAAEPTATVVEYRHAALDRYFLTANAVEIDALDAGTLAGWTRTGVTFRAWTNATDHAGARPVCRFYGKPGVGPDSHFYTADPDECAIVKANPAWIDEGIAFHVDVPASQACTGATQPVWRVYRSAATVGSANHRWLPDLTLAVRSGAGNVLEGVVMCAALASADIEADAVRLAEQATFGPTSAVVDAIRAQGAAAWIDAELAKPPTKFPSYPPVPVQRPESCVDDRTPPVTENSYCFRDNYTPFPLIREFWRNAIGAPDQLRQRVAFALSQMLVVSGQDVRWPYALGRYQQILVDRAFGDFESLLTAVTLSPAMGRYLDMANNRKADAATGSEPNENYARELLQLFSVGTWELKRDGTRLADASGAPIAAYDNEIVEGYAHVFTGWTYPTQPGQPARPLNGPWFDGTMEERDAYHDFGAKELLEDAIAPTGLSMGADLAHAIRSVFLHPNTPPFVARALIQKLVTGDPTPGYVDRVAAVFENDGRGVRGNLAAVARAILLDAEARGPAKHDPAYGKLREPALLVAGVARALGARTDGVVFRASTAPMGQFVYNAPSVFNFYPPDYVVPGTSLVGPEFGIQNTASALARINTLDALVMTSVFPPDPQVYGATGTTFDWTPWTSVAADTAVLVDRLDALLLHRTMSAEARAAIASAIDAIPASDPLGRARAGFSLVVTSSQYQVER